MIVKNKIFLLILFGLGNESSQSPMSVVVVGGYG